jgi:hypothetical protein
VAGPIQAAGAYAATGPLMLVRCRRNDGERPHTIALAFQATTGDRWSSHPLRARCASIAVLRLCGRVQRRPKPARVIHWLKKFAGLCRRPQIESTGNFGKAVMRRADAHIQGARGCPRQCCTRRRCALATDRRTFVLSPRGRRWLTYSFSARARARRFRRVCAASGFCSRVFLACLFRCSAQRAVKRIRGTPRMHG